MPQPTISPAAFALIGNMLRDACVMAQDGVATPADIDLAMRLGVRHPQGPIALADALDTSRRSELGLPPVSTRPPPSATAEVPAARFGEGPVGIVGTGFMARGLACATAVARQPVVLVGRREEAVRRALDDLERQVAGAVTRDRTDGQPAAEILSRIDTGTELEQLGSCELVIEEIAEDLTVKREMFARLDAALPDARLLASGTSSLRISDIATAVTRPERVGGLHFFSPVPAMRLVEVVPPPGPDGALAERTVAWTRSIGKTAVISADRPGFIVNSLLVPFLNDVARAAEDGARSPAELDELVVSELAHPMGPLALIDLIGLDVVLATLQALRRANPHDADRLRPAASLEQLVDAGELGRKTGQGFYTYGERRAAA